MGTIIIDRDTLLSDLAQLQRQGTPYGYGAKAEGGSDPRDGHRWNLRSNGTLDTPLSTIDNLDCSGAVRYTGYRASGGKFKMPDGSQAQLAYFRKLAQDPSSGVREITSHGSDADNYRAAAHYIGKRVFACFISPGVNGCGPVGHVFWLFDDDDPDLVAETGESHGGAGVQSRPWNTSVLLREVCAVFDVPTS